MTKIFFGRKYIELPVGTTDENFTEWGYRNYTKSRKCKAETFNIHQKGKEKTLKVSVQGNMKKGNRLLDSESDDIESERIWETKDAAYWRR